METAFQTVRQIQEFLTEQTLVYQIEHPMEQRLIARLQELQIGVQTEVRQQIVLQRELQTEASHLHRHQIAVRLISIREADALDQAVAEISAAVAAVFVVAVAEVLAEAEADADVNKKQT